MAEDVALNDEPSKSCCLKWQEQYTKLKERYSKLEEGRNALRKCITIYEQQTEKMKAENTRLKEAYENEKGRANMEKENSAKESAKKFALEQEIVTLKSEILSLQQNGGLVPKEVDEEIANLHCRLSKSETEVKQLKELLEKERIRVDDEQKKAEKEKRKAAEANKKVKAEESRANKEKKLADIERKKVEEFRHQLEALKRKADEAISKLALEKGKCEEAGKNLNVERERRTMERERASLEMAKVDKQRKAAEAKATDERFRADNLSQQLDQTRQRVTELENEIALVNSRRGAEFPIDQPEKQPPARILDQVDDICSEKMNKRFNVKEACNRIEKVGRKRAREKKKALSDRQKYEEQNQAVEACKKTTMREKRHDLECSKCRLVEVQDEIQKLISSPIVLPHPVASVGSLKKENAEMKLLREQLKFERRRSKHAKKLAKMEIDHNRILRQEVIQLKQGLVQFSHRLETLDECLLRSYGVPNKMAKVGNCNSEQDGFGAEPCQRKLQDCNVPRHASCTRSTSTSDSLKLMQSGICATPLAPISGETYIISNAASFSDRSLVGSQERGDFSLSASGKLQEEMENLEPTISGLSSDTVKSCNEKLALAAENSIGSPIKYAAAGDTCNRKKMRLLDAVKPHGCLQSAGQMRDHRVTEKLPVMHSTLHSQMDDPFVEERLPSDLQSNMHWKQFGVYKKRKSLNGKAVAAENLYGSSEPSSILGTSGIELTGLSMHASPKLCNPTNTVHVKDCMGDLSEGNHTLPKKFDEIINHDIMKLFDLDNDVDEERFRKAIERPLSPTLPQVEFPSNEVPEIGSNVPPSIKCSFGGFSNAKDKQETSCSFVGINLEIDSENTTPHGRASEIASSPEDKYFTISSKNSEKIEDVNRGCYSNGSWLICNSGLWFSLPRDQDSVIPCQSSSGNTSAKVQNYVVVSSNETDEQSIYKICNTVSNCMMHFSAKISLEVFMQNTFIVLKEAGDLSAKERICVFFSTLLRRISMIVEGDKGEVLDQDSIVLMDSFVQQLHAVLSDTDMKKMFMELFVMHELLALMEDFLLSKRILVYDYLSKDTINGCDSRASTGVWDSCFSFSTHVASTLLLVAGGVFLASVCVATDQIGVLCEVSLDIFKMQKNSSSLVLRLLHTFAHICGSKFFNLEAYGLELSVLKSLVVFIEKLNPPTDSTACFSSVLGPLSKNSPLINCPFLEGVASVDSIVHFLLEKLQQHGLAAGEEKDLVETFYLSNHDLTEETSGRGEAVSPNMVSNGNLFYSMNILSLLELVGSLLSWHWTFRNIVFRLQQMLESYFPVHISAAVITLLGQLGRLGVDSEGYEDSGVVSLREWLSAFLSQSSSRIYGLPIQVACATALAGLIESPFEEVIKYNSNFPAADSQSAAAACIRKWFSSLILEQQSSFKLLYSSLFTVT